MHGWRHIRLQVTGKNASGQTYYLSVSGFEIYGTVTGVCDDVGKRKRYLCLVASTGSFVHVCQLAKYNFIVTSVYSYSSFQHYFIGDFPYINIVS